MASKPGRGLDLPPSDPRLDPTPAQPGPAGPAVVALVSMRLGRSGPPPPSRRADRRNVGHDGLERGGVVDVGRGHHRVRGSPLPSQTRWSLLPGLPRSTGFAPTWSPRVWRARSWCPRSPAPSPAGPTHRGGPRPAGARRRTPRRWPTRSGAASRLPGNRSRARGRAAAATGSKCGPCTRSRPGRPDPRWCGAGAVGRTR